MQRNDAMSSNTKATVYERATGRIVAQVEAQDPADLWVYETDETTTAPGHFSESDHFINPATGRANKHKSDATRPKADLGRIWSEVKGQRNRLIADSAWATDPDSPLSDASRAEWAAYRAALHAVTKDIEDPRAVVFPEAPGIEFAAHARDE